MHNLDPWRRSDTLAVKQYSVYGSAAGFNKEFFQRYTLAHYVGETPHVQDGRHGFDEDASSSMSSTRWFEAFLLLRHVMEGQVGIGRVEKEM